jgi:hypothetical protein
VVTTTTERPAPMSVCCSIRAEPRTLFIERISRPSVPSM